MYFHLLNYLGCEMPGVFHTTYSSKMSCVFYTTYSGSHLGWGCEMPGVFHTTYSGHTFGRGVKCQVCFTQHTQVKCHVCFTQHTQAAPGVGV